MAYSEVTVKTRPSQGWPKKQVKLSRWEFCTQASAEELKAELEMLVAAGQHCSVRFHSEPDAVYSPTGALARLSGKQGGTRDADRVS